MSGARSPTAARARRGSWRFGSDAGGTLLWHGLPFVVTDGADVERRSSLTLEADARAVIRETLVLGRHGEQGGRLVSALAVVDSDGPILLERLDADGSAPEPGVLGGNRVLDAVIAVGFRPPTRPDDLEFDRPGAMARHLSDHTHGSPLDPVWDAWVAHAEERFSRVEPSDGRRDDRDDPTTRIRPSTIGVIAFIALLHVLGWGVLVLARDPGRHPARRRWRHALVTLGVGLTAYALGVRHAFDADHIAAIDNTTRRLAERGKPATTVGFWFSLGHSTIVVVLCILLTLGITAIGTSLADDSSALRTWTGSHRPQPSPASSCSSSPRINIASLRRRHGHAGGPVLRMLGPLREGGGSPVPDVRRRAAVRPRLRHRDRDRAAHPGRCRHARGRALVGGAHPAHPVRRRDERLRHHPGRRDASRLHAGSPVGAASARCTPSR